MGVWKQVTLSLGLMGLVLVGMGGCGGAATKIPLEKLGKYVPAYPGLQLEERGRPPMLSYPIAGTQKDLLTHAWGKVPDDAQTVLDFYKKELQKAGWKTAMSGNENLQANFLERFSGAHLSRRKGKVGLNLTLFVEAEGSDTRVIISLGPTEQVAPEKQE